MNNTSITIFTIVTESINQRRIKAMQDNKREIHYQLKDQQLEWAIMTDKYHLLRDNETYLGYQLKRMWYYLKLKLTK